MAVIVMIVVWFLSVLRLARFVSGLIGLLIGLAIAVLGPVTGGPVNPARQFGPAIVPDQLDFFGVYLLVSPMVGALAAATVHSVFVRRREKRPRSSGPGRPRSRDRYLLAKTGSLNSRNAHFDSYRHGCTVWPCL